MFAELSPKKYGFLDEYGLLKKLLWQFRIQWTSLMLFKL
jgi:hypothetical protein